MPPAKSRVAQDDSSTSSKQAVAGPHGVGRGKRALAAGAYRPTSTLKDANTADDSGTQAAQGGSTGLDWTTEDLAVLHNYRAAHKVETPSAFKSQLNQALLTNPGIGRQSPTMARKKAQRKTSKAQLALALRKNFNDAAVNETDVMVDMLYKVRYQDKAFRLRSNPMKNK